MVALLSLALLLATPPWGAHPVGFEVTALTDPSRPLHGAPRPIQMSFWYPAAHRAPEQVTFGDYVTLLATELGPASPEEVQSAVEEHAAFLRRAAKMSAADVERWLARPMRALPKAAPFTGKAPLILFAQGNRNSGADQALLCEFLASHGFAVATSPSPVRISGPMKGEEDIAKTAEDQALDLAILAKAARERPFVDPGPVALVAHSFGARSALLYAMHDGAAALVSLDGGIGTKSGDAELRSSRFFDPARANFPILHFYETLDAFMAPDFSFLHSLTAADRFIVRAKHLHHVHFTMVGEAVAKFPALARATHADASTAKAHDEVARMTLAFLQAAVGPRAPGRGSLDAAVAGAGATKAKFLTVQERLPPTLNQR